MIRLSIIKIIPVIVATIAFKAGLPGAFIQRARFGFKNVPMPNIVTIMPTMRSMMFVGSMVSTLVLLLFHRLVFLLQMPLLKMS